MNFLSGATIQYELVFVIELLRLHSHKCGLINRRSIFESIRHYNDVRLQSPFTHSLSLLLQEANIDARIFLKIEKLFLSQFLKSSTVKVWGSSALLCIVSEFGCHVQSLFSRLTVLLLWLILAPTTDEDAADLCSWPKGWTNVGCPHPELIDR